MKQKENYTAAFAERYILEGFAAFSESADLMRKAMDMIGGFRNLYFDKDGHLHSRFSDGAMSEEERERLISMIGDSWKLINGFIESMERKE